MASKSGTFFKYSADRLPVLLIVLMFAADFAVFLLVDNPYLVVGWMVLGIFPKACICSFGHHHQHITVFKQAIPNRLLEIILGFQTGITANAWFLHHVIGHHRNYLDQEKDESRWRAPNGETMGAVRYSFEVSLTGYWRAWKAEKKMTKPRVLFMVMVIVQIVLLGGLFWYNWLHTLILFAFPMALSLYITAWHTYYHHAGLATDGHFDASYNIMHKWYNILTCNLGYHTAHHYKCGVHWSELPALHETIKEKIPESCYRPPCLPFSLMANE